MRTEVAVIVRARVVVITVGIGKAASETLPVFTVASSAGIPMNVRTAVCLKRAPVPLDEIETTTSRARRATRAFVSAARSTLAVVAAGSAVSNEFFIGRGRDAAYCLAVGAAAALFGAGVPDIAVLAVRCAPGTVVVERAAVLLTLLPVAATVLPVDVVVRDTARK